MYLGDERRGVDWLTRVAGEISRAAAGAELADLIDAHDQDRNPAQHGVGGEAIGELTAIHHGEIEIEHDHVGRPYRRQRQGCRSILRVGDLEPSHLEQVPDECDARKMIIDDERKQ